MMGNCKFCREGIKCYYCTFEVAKYLVAYGQAKKCFVYKVVPLAFLVTMTNAAVVQDFIRPVWMEMEQQAQGYPFNL